MPMNDDDFMSVFTGRAKVVKQDYPVIPTMGTDTSYIDAQKEKQKELAQSSAIDFSFLDDDSLGLGEKLQKFWRVQTNTQTPDERLASAEKVGNALGLVPQTLAENDDLYKNAVLTYESQRNNAYLQGKPFTPQTVAELYPELDTEDTVATTLALRDFNNVLKTREAISQGVPVYALGTDDSLWGAYKAGAIEGANLPGYLFGKIADFANKAYDAGQALDKQSELMYRASTGELSDEEVEKELPSLMTASKELDTAIGDSYVAKIVGETISQLSMQKNMMLRGAEKIMAPLMGMTAPVLQASKSALPQAAAMGTAGLLGAAGATGAVAGGVVAGTAALAGALTLGTAAVFVGTYRAEAGQAYWDWRTKKGKNGQRTYTREQAIGHAKRVGLMNAAIEAGAWETALKGITKVYGREAATAVIKDTEAMKKLIGAGRNAMKLQSLKYGAKQFAKVAIPETVEEGLQSLTADIDTNLFGEGGISTKEMFNNALDAMIQAVPSVIGMSAGGSLLGGMGAYRAMKKISGLSEMKEAATEFKRSNETTMLQKMMNLRKGSSLFKKAPEAYRKTIQNQMDQSGMGTVYIDAQAAAENESTHEALNEMVEKGIVSAKELDESIQSGKPLEVESGKYMQLASEESPQVLADYTTMDKGEMTLHAIKEERQRFKEMIDLVRSTKEQREKAASEKILNEHFNEDTEKGREDRATAQELLSGGLENIQENYKALLTEAKKAWGELSSVKELQDYMERRKTQDANTYHEKGVDFVDTGEGTDRVHTRKSRNPGWYQDFYGENDRAPNQRELYDIAHKKTIDENDKGTEADAADRQELEAAKAKVESLERVGEVIKTLDKKDLVAQTLLDPDTYEEAYKPLLAELSKGNPKVTQAARDSALVLAKLAENFHKNYGIPLKLATIVAGKVSQNNVETILKQIAASKGLPETGKEFTMPYYHINNQGKVKMPGDMMAQSIEPAGEYMGHDTSSKMYRMPNATYGTITFKNPLVLEWKTSGHGGWKTELSEMFGGKKGKRLTNAIKKAGYDGIITVEKDKGYINEIVNITGIKSEYNESLIPNPPKLFQQSTFDAEENLKRDIQKWGEIIDKYKTGKLNDSEKVQVMNTPLAFKFAGAEVLPVITTASGIKHALRERHLGMTEEILRQMPEALADPMMIFKSYNGKKGEHRVTAVLDLKDENGATVIAAIELNHKDEGSGYIVNRLITAYGKTDKKSKVPTPSYQYFKANIDAGNTVYVNRKKTAEGFIPERSKSSTAEFKKSLDSLLSNKSIPDENDLSKLKNENQGYYQRSTEDTQDLVVTHNITTDKLKKSIQLGGLPMPSLGISRKGVKNDLEGFGEITLIGNKDMIDPEKSSANDVFSRDAYTGRFPKMVYKNPKLASIKEWKDELTESFDSVSSLQELKSILNELASINAGYMHDSVEESLLWSGAMKYHFLTKVLGKKIDIPYFNAETNAADKEFFEKNPDIYEGLLQSGGNYEKGKALSARILAHDRAEMECMRFLSLKKKMAEAIEENFPDGETISQEYFDKLCKRAFNYEDAMTHGEKTTNWLSLENTIRKMMKEGNTQELYKEYIEEKLDKAYSAPMLEVGDKKVALTLENVVLVMKRNRGKGRENSWIHGMNELLGYLAYRFTSVEDIRSQKGKLATNNKTEEHYAKAEKLYKDLMNRAYDFKENAYSEAEDAVIKALSEISKKGEKAKVENILKKSGLPSDAPMGQLVKDFLKEAKEVTTDYFEAKPARAVSFKEFSGAVVPKGTPKEMVDYLKEQGLTVETYDETVQGDQTKKAEELASTLNVYFQKAYHGSPYEFSKFDLGAIGSGEGNQAHGWGLYFTKDKSIAETRYRDRILKWLKRKGKLNDDSKGTVFEVDVPEDSVLLDEDKPLSEQPLAVRKAIADYYNSRPDDYITTGVDELPSTQTGERFYRDVVFQMQREGQEHPQKAASELLNSFGIKGITYEGSVDGRCFVVFDDQAISIIEKYNQEMNGSQYQGAYNPNSNVIEIFNGANQSTAIHEGAHMFLTSLESLSQVPEEELLQAFSGDTKAAQQSRDKVLKDLQTIRNWAVFSEEHLAEYKGTSLEKEFNAHAEAIRRGDANAEEIWIQERFARGFEKYLMDGSAPTREMRGVFRRFKSWLTDIYKTAKNLGNVKLTPEIKDVFDKMLATENEINAWAAQRKLESIDKAINVDKSELDNLKEWAENVKQKALEKAMSYYLHMVKEDAIEQFKASISSDEAKADFMKSLGEENEIYKIEQIYNSPTFPTKKDREAFLKANNISSEAELKQKLKDAGGASEERWQKNISDMVQSYKDEALTPEAVKSMAEEILNSPEGMERKSRIEAMLLEKKVTQYINLVTSMQLELKRSKNKLQTAREIRKRLGLATEKETAELEKQSETIAKSEEKITKLEKQVKDLREKLKTAKETAETQKAENKSRKESAKTLEGNLRAIERELEKERNAHAKLQETNDDTNLTVAELSAKLKAIKEGWQSSRKAMCLDMQQIKEDARNTLGEEKLSHAISWRWWQNQASIAEGKAMKAASQNDWDQAAYWKQAQAQDLIMAKQARANEDEIRHTLHGGGGKLTTAMLNENGMEKYGILGILNRIGRSDKPVMMQDDARYFVQHMAYVLGITKTDGRLPIDKSGMERAFSWKWLAMEMNPMQAMANRTYEGGDIIPSWMKGLFDKGEPIKLQTLTMNQFREMAKVMKAVYKLGRREYEGNTLGTSFEKASAEIAEEIWKGWNHRRTDPLIEKQTATSKDRLGTKFHKLLRSITLPEILIERMGKKATKYIYDPIDKATAHRRELKAEAKETMQKIFKMYSISEWAKMRNQRIYSYGIDDKGNKLNWTKEEVICMALNLGTQSNRTRVIETLWGTEDQLLKFLDTVLDDRDWDFIEAIWNHENSYWGARNKVQNDLYGVPLGKVPGLNFVVGKGRIIHGQYYRIKYDPEISNNSSKYQKDDIARMDMENMSAFSLGMGSTKNRAKTSGGQKLRFDLDVYTESIQEAIQHISMREAAVDVYKLLHQESVVAAIETTMGVDTLGELQNWAKDNWHSSIKDMCEWDSFFGRCRRRFTFATMGFRFSTALLNVGNIFGMMDRIGAYNTMKAMGDFYFSGGITEKWNFITTKSSMMKERAATMDRDTYIGDNLPVQKNESKLRSKIEHGRFGTDSINAKAYSFIAFTDMLCSCPEWLFTYRRALVALEQEGNLTREEMDQEAVRQADKAVRETFGSGEMKDQTEFMRKSGPLEQATAFFSYTNLVTNQFIRAGYLKYDTGNIKPLLKATWYWWILGALLETTLRAWGDDSDDEDKWKKKFAHVVASGGPLGGVPVIRETVPWAVDYLATGKAFGDPMPSVSSMDAIKYAGKAFQSLSKGEFIETGRATSKLLTRTTIPLPDTITDAFWNFIYLISTDNNYTMTDFLWKSLWDRSLKDEKKGKKKRGGND